MNRKLATYIALFVAAGVASWAWLFVSASGDVGGEPNVWPVLTFVLVGFLAQVQSFRLPSSAAASLSFLPFLSAALVAPYWWTVGVVAACIAAAEVIRRASLVKGVFNVGQFTFAVAAGTLSYRMLGGTALKSGSSIPLLAYAALVTIFFAINTLSVSGAVALSQGKPLIAVWRSNTVRTLIYDIVALPVLFCFVQVYLKLGSAMVGLLAFLVLLARQLYTANLELERANQDLLQVMVAAIEMRDPYTSGHSQRVAEYSKIIARAIGLSTREVERVGVAALLHDVGKIDQRFAEILQKPGKLTEEERLVIEEHPVRSAELVAMVNGLQDLVKPVRHHHERWDGGGYPDGLAGEAIPLTARIIVFADTIDAMTSDRPYRPALGPADVRRELVKHRGKQFDPYICDRLLSSELYAQIFKPAAPPVSVIAPLPVHAPTPQEPVIAA